MTLDEMRVALLDSTVNAIGTLGIDKTTTKVVAGGAKINEAYIYRVFLDKEDLFKNTFSFLDDELLKCIEDSINLVADKEHSEEAFYLSFCKLWSFVLGNQNKCLAFIRYYYSPYFKKHSFEEHAHRFGGVVEKLTPLFKPKANVWMLINHVLNTVLDFAVKVFNGDVENNEDTRVHVFKVCYSALVPYLKNV
ncbi:MAG: TetR/AcrR family transcriptional regulator [Ruminococcaceae bacterium]|nr:TetR/AcrR family transcriptional regulator [Oscillospiraceae bacterium]